jgi:hypothetical protein
MACTRLVTLAALVLVSIALAGCVPSSEAVHHTPGFADGLLHGITALFAVFGGWDVYQSPNTGYWYDAGFLISVAALFGGGTWVGTQGQSR